MPCPPIRFLLFWNFGDKPLDTVLGIVGSQKSLRDIVDAGMSTGQRIFGIDVARRNIVKQTSANPVFRKT